MPLLDVATLEFRPYEPEMKDGYYVRVIHGTTRALDVVHMKRGRAFEVGDDKPICRELLLTGQYGEFAGPVI